MYIFICSWTDTAYEIASHINGDQKVEAGYLFAGLLMGFLTGSCIFNFLINRGVAAKKMACAVMILGAVALAMPAYVLTTLASSDRFPSRGNQIFIPYGEDAALNREVHTLNVVGGERGWAAGVCCAFFGVIILEFT